MSVFQAVVLGAVQGLTEFLPISSSGHLVIFPILLNWREQPVVFDTTMHIATACALSVYFWKDIWNIARNFFADFSSFGFALGKYTENGALALKIVVGCIPAGLLGFFFEDAFETYFRSVESVMLFLMAGALLIYFAEKLLKREDNKITYKKSFLIGLFQSLALFPGFSRSGSTISGGMFLGLTRENAARYSFLLSIPIIFAAGFYKLLSTEWTGSDVSFGVLGFGFISSFVVGLAAIKILLEFVKKNTLYVFVVYRIVLFLILSLIIF
ncbi:undecaprenyl-diphosphatase UppP [candidate division WWE3 bacterium]|jgi:undecaprenyl-diphosphatase|uniref:Undecaprenyl-diphosphatase n=1 Tax=candidate division WWE3 bacterium TaxID=2053526 RepID=A0A3A4ZL85_UNCKA|nr:MAG: undecaprenyl-diphosphatase UppP [candidate division WWE3 bacterium]